MVGRVDVNPGTPKLVYKYLPAKWAHRLVCYGEMRIGTLQSFRRMEGADVARGDAREGTVDVFDAPPVVNLDTGEGVSPIVRHVVNLHGAGIRFFDCRFSVEHSIPDAYMYCVSEIADRAVMAAFGGADTCVEISDINPLLRVLLQRMGDLGLVSEGWCGPCLYRDRLAHYTESFQAPIAYLKETRHAAQREWRVVLKPGALPIHVENIRCPEIREFCRIVKVL